VIGARLDRRISILRKSITLLASGEPVEAWSPIAISIAASIAPMSGEERFAGDQFVAREQVEIRVRWRAALVDLSPLDRIVEPALSLVELAGSPPDTVLEGEISDRRQLEIMAAHELGRREGWRILAARRVDQLTIST